MRKIIIALFITMTSLFTGQQVMADGFDTFQRRDKSARDRSGELLEKPDDWRVIRAKKEVDVHFDTSTL